MGCGPWAHVQMGETWQKFTDFSRQRCRIALKGNRHKIHKAVYLFLIQFCYNVLCFSTIVPSIPFNCSSIFPLKLTVFLLFLSSHMAHMGPGPKWLHVGPGPIFRPKWAQISRQKIRKKNPNILPIFPFKGPPMEP